MPHDGVLIRTYPHHPQLGRIQVRDPRSLDYRARLTGRKLKAVHWDPKIPVLDQGHYFEQGIHTSRIVPGAGDVNELGCCTGNAGLAALSWLLTAEQCATAGIDVTNPVRAEEWAIGLYAQATLEDEWLTQQWPPTDCGSSGLGVARALKARGLIQRYTHATSAETLCDLLQDGPVVLGTPWYNAWFDPNRSHFVDRKGWQASGVAGGHEVCVIGIERMAMHLTGSVDQHRTVLRIRNSWGPSFGDSGTFLIHLSTLYGAALRSQVDAVQLQTA